MDDDIYTQYAPSPPPPTFVYSFISSPGPSIDATPKISCVLELKDKTGALHDVLKYFWKYDLNITRIEVRAG